MCLNLYHIFFSPGFSRDLKFRVGHEQVIRNGRRVEISIYDIVVGDVIPLNIGDQVHEHFSVILMFILLDCFSSLIFSF